jgi:hypothetical protein
MKMYPSTSTSKRTLATLTWLANCSTTQEIEEFRANNPHYIPADMAWLTAPQFLRQIWKGGKEASRVATLILCGQGTLRSIINSVKQAVAADAESPVTEEAAILLLPNRVDWPRRELVYKWPSELQKDLYQLLKQSHLAKVCKRSNCPEPYFVAEKVAPKYCSIDCADAMQNEWRRRWWRENGNEWRSNRKSKPKPKRQLKRSR